MVGCRRAQLHGVLVDRGKVSDGARNLLKVPHAAWRAS